ncbi:OmpH family outer membrane protein [Albidovulum sediminicola]|uniref:OmpH family outer membrane protein n=1 Tax=Albidovulum sediminicola TaxID=2984331 RepID=A0ABT2Z0W3_9RHOB|nr:OmpH family outer membrane protein [Defluviimonas sp. WL0075]MCV2864376.1 OmpH family outer membrane protein [Defluviimonas sp. WL0075]
MRGLFAVLSLAVALAVPAAAQEMTVTSGPRPLVASILVLDQERLFEGSLWGKRVIAEIEAESNALAAENRRIEADLQAEEQDLTDKRQTLPTAEFRALADAFDAKVIDIRRNQDTKARDLVRLNDAERQAFLATAVPVLRKLLAETPGAVAILDRRTVLIAADVIDITDEAVARIDATLGAGQRPQLPPAEN